MVGRGRFMYSGPTWTPHRGTFYLDQIEIQ